jgi:hypothetical protein
MGHGITAAAVMGHTYRAGTVRGGSTGNIGGAALDMAFQRHGGSCGPKHHSLSTHPHAWMGI